MSDMNSVLSVWQLVIMAVIPVAALAGWIIAVFMVAREPRPQAASAASANAASPTSQDQPLEPAPDRLAA
jgi:cytoskeletal protein RodZ